MSKLKKLGRDEVEILLEKIDGWVKLEDREAITKTYIFKNFVHAFGFMTKSALVCEKIDHHPEWFNVYKVVEVVLTTHDVDGVTELDFKLAKAMDKIAQS